MDTRTSDIELWRPPSVVHDDREMEVWNAIISYAGRSVPLGNANASMEFRSASRPASTTSIGVIELDDGTWVGTVIRSFPFAEMYGVDIDIAELSKLPDALRNSLEEGMVATLWSAIPDHRMGTFRFVGTGLLDEISEQIDVQDWQWLDIRLEGVTPVSTVVSVGMPISAFVRAVSGGKLAPAQFGNTIATLLTMEASFTLGSVSLTLDELAKLRSGDIVALPKLSDEILIRANWTSYSLCRAEEGWLCVSRQAVERYRLDPDIIKGSSMTGVLENTAGNSTDFGDLSIVIDFDLGRVTVPLSAIQSWQPGSIVPLDLPPADNGVEVTIRANGQLIGNGDLVRIDDRVAVRLTRLSIGR